MKQLIFGWCLPTMNEHNSCKQSFTLNGDEITCECDCHKKKEGNK